MNYQSSSIKKFVWEPGEYAVEISVKCNDERQNVSRSFRFTLFESDSDELRGYVDKYKYGEGVYYASEINVGIITNILEINA